jgi:ketosteroid isomerase-like protein
MPEENVEVVRQLNLALNRGDLEGALSHLADTAEIRDLRSAPDQPLTVTGRDAIRGVWAEWSAAFEELRAEVEEWIDAGDAVIAHAQLVGNRPPKAES